MTECEADLIDSLRARPLSAAELMEDTGRSWRGVYQGLRRLILSRRVVAVRLHPRVEYRLVEEGT